VDAVVDFQLWALDRAYRLPGTGSRSVLFRFDDVEGQPIFGAAATQATAATSSLERASLASACGSGWMPRPVPQSSLAPGS
jgi:hypothetical protein